MSEEHSGGGGIGRASDFVGGQGARDAGRRRGKIGRTLRGGSPATQTGGEASPAARAAGGKKPVRITVDLDPELHRHLKQAALDAGVRGAAVVRGLLELHRDEPQLAARLEERLEGR